MVPTIVDIQNKLNSLYFTDRDRYLEHIEMFKGMGYRIFRNPAGNHKIQMDNSYLDEAFGGIFKDIFRRNYE